MNPTHVIADPALLDSTLQIKIMILSMTALQAI
jgi:hypothetical protein